MNNLCAFTQGRFVLWQACLCWSAPTPSYYWCRTRNDCCLFSTVMSKFANNERPSSTSLFTLFLYRTHSLTSRL